RRGGALGQIAEEALAAVAEDAAPHAVEVDRDDRDVAALADPLEPAPERVQHPGPRDLPLREDADQVAVVEVLARVAQRPQDRARSPLRADRERPQPAQPAPEDRP